jgi:hypothetical protein
MKIYTRCGTVSPFQGGEAGLRHFRREIESLCANDIPFRLSVTQMKPDAWDCEIECIEGADEDAFPAFPSLFSFRRRQFERTHAFTAVMLVPTGIDCAIGGHAGDATPAARLLATVCDHVILHPNVVNASDINEQTDNCVYVEGSLICRLLMGEISLRKVRSNRILVLTERRQESPLALDLVINTTNAARATLGIECPKVLVLPPDLRMTMASSPSGRAVGEIAHFDSLIALLQRERESYDAVALATHIQTRFLDGVDLSRNYYLDDAPNPWGGVEAALTHIISMICHVPSAHAPMMEDSALSESYGLVDPRKAAEVISNSFMFCLFKGLQRSPSVVLYPDSGYDPALLAVEDISCLVIPDGCVGLPTLAALLQGIPVIAVRNNTNRMKNDLHKLPFQAGQLWVVENYLEAAGLLAALKVGLHPHSLARPLARTPVTEMEHL